MSNKKVKRNNEPSKEEAALALASIKELQKTNDEDQVKIAQKEEELRKQREFEEAERIKIQIAQEQVRRKLRENLQKKEEQEKEKANKSFLESSVGKKTKIKWKSVDNGDRVLGYVNNRLMFEIKKGLALFSLYIKDKKILEEKKINSYQGCSMLLVKLKDKSNKFV